MSTTRGMACMLVLALFAAAGPAGQAGAEPLVGGYARASVTNADVIAAAAFAIQEKDAELSKGDKPAELTLVEIKGAEQQVVAGLNYRLALRVKVNAAEKDAMAVVWSQPWNKDAPLRLTSWTWK